MSRRSKSRFRKFYCIYLGVLAVLLVMALCYVYFTLISLEKNQPENFVKASLVNLTDDEIKSLFTYNENYESSNDYVNNIRSFFKHSKYEIKKEDHMVYGVYNQDNLIIKVTLKSNNHVSKLGLIVYDELVLEKVEGNEQKELFSYTIKVPSNYSVTINNKEAVDSKEVNIEGFIDGYDYVSIPKINTYELHNLTKEPAIIIKNNNENVSFEMSKTIDLSDQFKKYDTLEAAGITFDVMQFAKNWSLFLTNDLTGPLHGLYTITANLINGTGMYDKAYKWATNVDITFTSRHILKNPTFTNEKISNITVYSDEAFSCDVYLEKNMVVNGQDKVDKLNSTLYFVKYNGEYKVVNIKGVTN